MTNEQIKAMSEDEFLAWTNTLPRPPLTLTQATLEEIQAGWQSPLTRVRIVGWQHPVWGNQLMAVYRDESGNLYRQAVVPF